MSVKYLIFFAFYNFCWCQYKNPYIYEDRLVIAQLFEWKFEDIAKECEFLAQNGYGAVQVSPVQESKVDEKYSWLLRYHPVSYKIHSRSGDLDDFKAMIRACQKVKIRVYVDIVINHMAGGKEEVVGTAKSVVKPKELEYPAIPFNFANFNDNCEIKDATNAFEIRNCRLDGLPDLNQTNEDTRNAIVDFMNRLIDCGVGGFRMDAVKHMWPADLAVIYGRLKELNVEFDFPPKSRPLIYQEVIDLGGDAVSKNEYVGLGMVTEYLNSKELVLVFNGKKSLHQFIKADDNGFVSSSNAIVFVDNHDNQRMFVEGFSEILNYKKKRRYLLANIFMLAYPYGIAKIMSSFKFNHVHDGPPMAENHMIMSPIFDEQHQCVNGWICEHRWPIILSMVKFRNVVGKSPLSNYADNGQNQIAFCRGELGFIAMNNEISLNMKSYVKACVPPGTYCDIITGEIFNGKCTGDEVEVDQDGKVNIFIPWTKEVPVVAIHVKSRKN